MKISMKIDAADLIPSPETVNNKKKIRGCGDKGGVKEEGVG